MISPRAPASSFAGFLDPKSSLAMKQSIAAAAAAALSMPLAFLFLLLCLCSSPVNSDLASDRAALLALRSSLHGRPLLWNLSASPCSWEGVKCALGQVVELRVPGMGLRGELPSGVIGNLTGLQTLSLRFNSLGGSLPPDLAGLLSLRYLYLQGNKFSGELPDFLFSMQSLVRLNLAANEFDGVISPRFNNLSRLSALYLEQNNFTGSIPELNLRLDQFNVSFNHLSGAIPTLFSGMPESAFEGNSLCGKPLSLCNATAATTRGHKLSSRAIATIVVASLLILLLVLAIVILICFCMRSAKKKHDNSEKTEAPKQSKIGIRAVRKASDVNNGFNSLVFIRKQQEKSFDLEELLKASAEVLGKGTFGTTYKASLGAGITVAVKRLKDVSDSESEFIEKIKEIGAMNHENLVPLVAYHYSKDEKLLVYEYMPTGSLSALLHDDNGAGWTPLSWDTRCAIALRTAQAVAHIHSQGPGASHGNIKSSNVLLTKSYEPRISDYGLACLAGPAVSPSRFHGYRAPEVIDVRIVSREADVYSFGVLILELVTGKAPSTSLLAEDGVDLPRWARGAVEQGPTAEVFDTELLRYQNVEEDMVRMLQIGIDCTEQSPDQRPSMAQVTKRMESLSQFHSFQEQD
ncbi:hypothetical protein BT93_F3378 [Corymbia citriodora subsp. variegata]|nr:hypothetical protein BT93_F3378 [Corymbia citriodora subsp. variegata]